jgi:hypothetical protein
MYHGRVEKKIIKLYLVDHLFLIRIYVFLPSLLPSFSSSIPALKKELELSTSLRSLISAWNNIKTMLMQIIVNIGNNY